MHAGSVNGPHFELGIHTIVGIAGRNFKIAIGGDTV